MGKLPLRPLFFVPAYLLLAAVSSLLGTSGLEISGFWPFLFGLGCFALHFAWTFRALAFVSKRLRSMRYSVDVSEPLPTARRFLLVLIVCFGGAVLYKTYLQPALFGGTPFDKPLEMALAFATVFLFFGIFWISARALCEAEMGRKVPAHSIVGTFLLFIYIVIGAPFIYRRLKKLGEQSPDGIAEPA